MEGMDLRGCKWWCSMLAGRLPHHQHYEGRKGNGTATAYAATVLGTVQCVWLIYLTGAA
jgi:hypothetical protein